MAPSGSSAKAAAAAAAGLAGASRRGGGGPGRSPALPAVAAPRLARPRHAGDDDDGDGDDEGPIDLTVPYQLHAAAADGDPGLTLRILQWQIAQDEQLKAAHRKGTHLRASAGPTCL